MSLLSKIPISKIPRRKRFRIVGRSICLVVGFIFAYWAAILIGKGSYSFAFFPSIVVFIASFAEFILMDVFTEKIYPARTEKILADLEEKIPKIKKICQMNWILHEMLSKGATLTK